MAYLAGQKPSQPSLPCVAAHQMLGCAPRLLHRAAACGGPQGRMVCTLLNWSAKLSLA